MISATFEGFQHSSLVFSQLHSSTEIKHSDAFLRISKVAPAPRLVKALDRYAAHIRAALTSLGARTQNTFRYEGYASKCRPISEPFCMYLRAFLSV